MSLLSAEYEMLLQIQKLEVPNTVGHDFAFSASYDKGRQLKHQPSLFETPKQPIQAMSPPKPTSKVMVYDQKFRAYMLNSSMNLCKIKINWYDSYSQSAQPRY